MSARVLEVLQTFGNSLGALWEFIEGVRGCEEVDFAILYGSALNLRLAAGEIEDVDILVVTREKRFIHDWNQPKGAEVRYMRLAEVEAHLSRRKARGGGIHSEAYRALAGVFLGALLAVKYSENLDRMIREIRNDVGQASERILSQMVEHECKKMTTRMPDGRGDRGREGGHRSTGGYLFHGAERVLSREEADSIVEKALKRRNIIEGKRAAVKKAILKRARRRDAFDAFAVDRGR